MKHFYFFLLAIATMFSTQLLLAQTISSPVNGNATGLIASRTDFGTSGMDLNYRREFLKESYTGKASVKNDEGVLTSEYNASGFSIITNDSENAFEANFTAPKSGKAELSIKTISGQVIYKENISIIKGSNLHLIKSQQLNNGMYLVSIKNDQVNYNGKIQKM